MCYFMDTPLEDLPYLEVPLHTLIKIIPVASGCEIEKVTLGVKAVDTHRPRTVEASTEVTDDQIIALAESTASSLSISHGDRINAKI